MLASLSEELDQLKQNREGYASLYQATPSTIETENQHVLRSLSVEQVSLASSTRHIVTLCYSSTGDADIGKNEVDRVR